jgi:hypothetical protein
VTAQVAPTSSTDCPETFDFNGTITLTGPGGVNVIYEWVRSDGGVEPPQALFFIAPGTQNVPVYQWTLGEPGFIVNGWAKLRVTSPNTIESSQANFMLNCPPPTLSPTPTPTDTPLPPAGVTSVTVDPAAPPVLLLCPGAVNFTGQITVDGPTIVNYEWEQSDGTTVPALPIAFAGPGSQPINHSWAFGAGPIILNSLWVRVNIISPNPQSSLQSTFDVNCP